MRFEIPLFVDTILEGSS